MAAVPPPTRALSRKPFHLSHSIAESLQSALETRQDSRFRAKAFQGLVVVRSSVIPANSQQANSSGAAEVFCWVPLDA